MWFVFPQVAGLGRARCRCAMPSARPRRRRRTGAPGAGARLRGPTDLMLGHAGTPAAAIPRGIDAVKFRSSMTLFRAAAPAEPRFHTALDAFYGGEPDPRTLALLAA